jgi:hypothetical protein
VSDAYVIHHVRAEGGEGYYPKILVGVVYDRGAAIRITAKMNEQAGFFPDEDGEWSGEQHYTFQTAPMLEEGQW